MTGDSLKYKYLNSNALFEKVDYSYSVYNGESFLKAWKASRKLFTGIYDSKNIQFDVIIKSPTSDLFLSWINNFNDNTFKDFKKLNLLLKRFEVTRKIYEGYDESFRPTDKKINFKDIDLYTLFSFVLVKAYKSSKKLYYLNSLLKVNDIILSNEEVIHPKIQSLFNYCVNQEIGFIENLRKELE
jgi:hypothetical protein